MESLTLSDELVDAAKEAASEDGCSLSEQIEHWAHLGRLMENNPDVTYDGVMEILESMDEETEEPQDD